MVHGTNVVVVVATAASLRHSPFTDIQIQLKITDFFKNFFTTKGFYSSDGVFIHI